MIVIKKSVEYTIRVTHNEIVQMLRDRGLEVPERYQTWTIDADPRHSNQYDVMIAWNGDE